MAEIVGPVRVSIWLANLDVAALAGLGAAVDSAAGARIRAKLDEPFDWAFLEGQPHVRFRVLPRADVSRSGERVRRKWCIDFDSAPIKWGRTLPGHLCMSVSLASIESATASKLTGAMQDFARMIAGQEGFCSGFGDVAGFCETAGGAYFESSIAGSVLFRRQLDEMVWVRECDRFNKLRCVCWANVLSATMMGRLGGMDHFSAEYIKLDDRRDKDLCAPLPGGGALVRICEKPTDLVYPFRGLMPATLERAAWLHDRLGRAGLLVGTGGRGFR